MGRTWLRGVLFVGLPCFLIVVGGIALSKWGAKYFDTKGAVLAITIAGVGVWSFFGFLFLNHHATGGGGGFSSDDMRTAIASALVLTYVALVAIMLFSEIDPKTVAATSLLSSFTTLLGVVIAFYFGSTAAVDVARAMYGPDPPRAD